MSKSQGKGRRGRPASGSDARCRSKRRATAYNWALEQDLTEYPLLHPMVSGLFRFVVSSGIDGDIPGRGS